MKRKVIIISLFIIVIIGVVFFLNNNKKISVKAEKENNNTKIIEKDEKPKENEPYKNTTIIENNNSDQNEKIELKYDEYIIANGFTGASDHAYYTRNNSLYHLTISTNETIKLAEGVEKIEDDKDTLIAYKGKNFKIIKEDNYITYLD